MKGEQGDRSSELEALRQRIDGIDAQLVELLAQRQSVVGDVLALKKRGNLPLYHPAREENLISTRRAQAEAAGLSPDFIEELFRSLLRRSRESQAEGMAAHGVRAGHRVLLVGGNGAMGRWFGRVFEASGYETRVLEKDDWSRADELCSGVDLALLTVPIDRTEAAAYCIGPHLPPQCVLADVTSVKERPLAAMMAAHAGPVVGLHPMFGPRTASIDKQIVVVSEGRGEEQWRWIPEQFAAWGAVIVRSGAREHDDIMAIVQALRHFATFAFGQFLYRRRADLARTLDFSSPIYRLELAMVGRLFAQDPGLYSEIIFATPERSALLKEYLSSIGDNLSMIVNGDKESFEAEFSRIAEWFGPFSDQAIRESTYLIEKLIERF